MRLHYKDQTVRAVGI